MPGGHSDCAAGPVANPGQKPELLVILGFMPEHRMSCVHNRALSTPTRSFPSFHDSELQVPIAAACVSSEAAQEEDGSSQSQEWGEFGPQTHDAMLLVGSVKYQRQKQMPSSSQLRLSGHR